MCYVCVLCVCCVCVCVCAVVATTVQISAWLGVPSCLASQTVTRDVGMVYILTTRAKCKIKVSYNTLCMWRLLVSGPSCLCLQQRGVGLENKRYRGPPRGGGGRAHLHGIDWGAHGKVAPLPRVINLGAQEKSAPKPPLCILLMLSSAFLIPQLSPQTLVTLLSTF